MIIARRSVVSLEASNIDELFRRAAAAAGSRAESPLDHDSHSLLAGAHHSAPDSMSPPSDAEHSGDRFDGLAVYCRVLEHANQEHKVRSWLLCVCAELAGNVLALGVRCSFSWQGRLCPDSREQTGLELDAIKEASSADFAYLKVSEVGAIMRSF